MLKAARRSVLLAVAMALVLVPALARARQAVECREATRLSIKHSWLGVAPPSKASVAPQPILMLPAVAGEPEPPRVAHRRLVAAAPAPHPVRAHSPAALRGPPSTSLAY